MSKLYDLHMYLFSLPIENTNKKYLLRALYVNTFIE